MSGNGGMRLPTLTALVTGTIIGSGIFTLPAALAEYGSITLVGFAITAFGSLMIALVFAMLSRRTPAAGGPYAYARDGFGEFIGFQTGWNYWIGAWAGVGAIGVSMIGYLGELIPGLSDNRLAQILVAVAVVAAFVWINDRGVQAGGLATLVLTILKVVPLVLVATLGMLSFQIDNLSPAVTADTSAFAAITAAITLTLFAFIGVEAASIPAQEVHDPTRTIPRATVYGTLLSAAVYLLSTTAVFAALPNDVLRNSDAPFSEAARVMFGDWAGPAFAVVAVISCLGAMNGLLLLSAQVPLAAANDGMAPSVFGRLNARRAPTLGLLISGVLAAALVVFNFSGSSGVVQVYQQLLLISTLATLFPYIFTAGAQMKWLIADRHAVPVAHFARNLVITLLALAYSIVAVMGAGVEPVYWGFVLVLLGVPLYVLLLRSRRGPDVPATTDVTADV